MLDLDFDFDCEHCNQTITVEESRAGQAIKCPACGHTIVVPGASREKARAAVTVATRPCPHCSKPIKVVDDRCRHCKGWTGKGPSPEETKLLRKIQDQTVGKGSVRPTGIDWMLVLFFPWAMAPIALWYLIAGYTRRGLIMLMLALPLTACQLAGLVLAAERWPRYVQLPF